MGSESFDTTYTFREIRIIFHKFRHHYFPFPVVRSPPVMYFPLGLNPFSLGPDFYGTACIPAIAHKKDKFRVRKNFPDKWDTKNDLGIFIHNPSSPGNCQISAK